MRPEEIRDDHHAVHPDDQHHDHGPGRRTGRLLLVNLGATVAAGVATEAWVGIMRATGVDLRIGDPFGDPSSAMALPVGACATSIVMCMVLGTALAVGLNWKARRPAYTYVVVASVLTFVSLGAPLVSAGASAGTQVHADRGAPDRGRGDRPARGAVPAAVVTAWFRDGASATARPTSDARPTATERVDAAFRRSTYG